MQTPSNFIPFNNICQGDLALGALPDVAVLANLLAKQLDEQPDQQQLAYDIKNRICDLLIVEGRAWAHSVSANGAVVGLTLDGDRHRRIHILRRALSPAARKVISEQISGLPVVVSLGEMQTRRSA